MKILFLEDTDIWISTYTQVLSHFFDCDITQLTTSRGVDKYLSGEKYDVILCDHFLAGSEGTFAYDKARRGEESMNLETPFIHHSSMPCPDIYRGSTKDKNFYTVFKTGKWEELIDLLAELGFTPKSVKEEYAPEI